MKREMMFNEKEKSSITKELSVLKRGDIWLALLVAMFSFGSVFALFTYITPILTKVTGYNEHYGSFLLVIFGIGVTIGNIFGGKLADWYINLIRLTLFILQLKMSRDKEECEKNCPKSVSF